MSVSSLLDQLIERSLKFRDVRVPTPAHSGDFRLRWGGRDIGQTLATMDIGKWQGAQPFHKIEWSELDPDLRGYGLGPDMYEDALARYADEVAPLDQMPLYSDDVLSPGSRKVYPILAKRGWNVENVAPRVGWTAKARDNGRGYIGGVGRDGYEQSIYRITGRGPSRGTTFYSALAGVPVGAGALASLMNDQDEAA